MNFTKILQATIQSTKKAIDKLKDKLVIAYVVLILTILSNPLLYYWATKNLTCD